MAQEAELISKVRQLLIGYGLFYWRANTGARGHVRFGFKGFPDFGVLLPSGVFFGIECKSPTGKQSVEQVFFAQCIKAKTKAHYLCSASFEEIEATLAGLMKGEAAV